MCTPAYETGCNCTDFISSTDFSKRFLSCQLKMAEIHRYIDKIDILLTPFTIIFREGRFDQKLHTYIYTIVIQNINIYSAAWS